MNIQDDLIKALTGEEADEAPEKEEGATDIIDSGVKKDEIPAKRLILRKKAIEKTKETM